jgi:predicted transcriptional regulator
MMVKLQQTKSLDPKRKLTVADKKGKAKRAASNDDNVIIEAEEELVRDLLERHKLTLPVRRSREVAFKWSVLVEGSRGGKKAKGKGYDADDDNDEGMGLMEDGLVHFEHVQVSREELKQKLHEGDGVLAKELGLIPLAMVKVALYVFTAVWNILRLTKARSWLSSSLAAQARQTIRTATVLSACEEDENSELAEMLAALGEEHVSHEELASALGCTKSEIGRAMKRREGLVTAGILATPADALRDGAYFFSGRAGRSDVTPPELVDLIYAHAHDNSDVVEQLGDYGRVKRENKKKDAIQHTQRDLKVTLMEAYDLFLESQPYLEWKEANGVIDDIGTTTFYAHFHCFCHAKKKQAVCACKYCTQMWWYCQAISATGTLYHGQHCDCGCDWCTAGKCNRFAQLGRNLHEYGTALLCGQYDVLDDDAELKRLQFSCMLYPTKCIEGRCEVCGFDKKVPYCEHVQGNTTCTLEVKKWGTVGAHRDQVVLVEMTVAQLFAEAAEYFMKDYIVHHTAAKVQKTAMDIATRKFERDTLLFQLDFAEKPRLEGEAVVTCSTAPTCILMIAFAHYNPRDELVGGVVKHVHDTDVWMFVSDALKQDASFHKHCCLIMLEHYKGELEGVTNCMCFTDGCAGQYKGAGNFTFVATCLQDFGVRMMHIFAQTSHFKGPHDGMASILKQMLYAAVALGQVINTSQQVADFFKEHFRAKGEMSNEEYMKRYSTYRVKRTFIQHVAKEEVKSGHENDLDGIEGTKSMFQFAGLSNPGVQVTAATADAEANGFDYKLAYKLHTRRLSCFCALCWAGNTHDCLLAEKADGLFGVTAEKEVMERVPGVNELPLTEAAALLLTKPELKGYLARRGIAFGRNDKKQVVLDQVVKAIRGEPVGG